MTVSVEEFVKECFDELQLSQRFVPYARRAEESGFPQIAKLFRALVVGENAREALLRRGMVTHSNAADDYFVCPSCGLVFHAGFPDQCPVDQTPGTTFKVIT